MHIGTHGEQRMQTWCHVDDVSSWLAPPFQCSANLFLAGRLWLSELLMGSLYRASRWSSWRSDSATRPIICSIIYLLFHQGSIPCFICSIVYLLFHQGSIPCFITLTFTGRLNLSLSYQLARVAYRVCVSPPLLHKQPRTRLSGTKVIRMAMSIGGV